MTTHLVRSYKLWRECWRVTRRGEIAGELGMTAGFVWWWSAWAIPARERDQEAFREAFSYGYMLGQRSMAPAEMIGKP